MTAPLTRYRKLAVEHGECTYSGARPSKTDAVRKKLERILQKLVAAQEDHRLLELFNDEDLWVQIWAAAHTLEIAEDIALEKLKELATTKYGLTRTTAQLIVQEWNAGNLRFRKKHNSTDL